MGLADTLFVGGWDFLGSIKTICNNGKSLFHPKSKLVNIDGCVPKRLVTSCVSLALSYGYKARLMAWCPDVHASITTLQQTAKWKLPPPTQVAGRQRSDLFLLLFYHGINYSS